MKKSQLRKLIREEIKHLTENQLSMFDKEESVEEEDVIYTKKLAKHLDKLNIPYKFDTEYLEELTDIPILTLKILNPHTKDYIYAGYDFVGYVVEGDGLSDGGLDQASLDETIKYLKNLFSKKPSNFKQAGERGGFDMRGIN